LEEVIAMAYTGTEIFNMSVAIMDALSDTGAVTDAQTKDYKFKTPYLLDLWQHEDRNIQTTVRFLRKPAKNLLGRRFAVEEHIAEDKTFEANKTARAAVFTVTDRADVYIEALVSGAWENADGFYSRDGGEEEAFSGLIAVSEPDAPAVFKCRLNPAGTNTRVRFSGDYSYLFGSFALFEAAFPSCGKVPDYGEYVKYPMPANFDRVTQVLTEEPRAGISHRWENNGDLMVNYDYEGELKITYHPNPTKLTTVAQLALPLEISEASAAVGAYYLAMHFAIADALPELAGLCKTEYERLKEEAKVKRPLGAARIQDVYNIAGIR
jgi:hypothetical protein